MENSYKPASQALMFQAGKSLVTQILNDVCVEPLTSYYFSCKVKVNNIVPGKIWHTVELAAMLRTNRGLSKRLVIARMPQMTPEDDWVQVGGDMTVLADTSKLSIVACSDPGVLYDVDEWRLVQITPNKNWKTQANRRIELKRKGDIIINLRVSSKYNPSKVKIELRQVKHAFPFGSAVEASRLYSPKPLDQAYTKFFFDNFDWATMTNAMKWRFMEPKRGQVFYGTVDKALRTLKSRGVTVRAHCVTWGKPVKIPQWLKDANAEEVEKAVRSRMVSLAQRYKDQFAQWEVCNEQLHGDWYEQHTKDIRHLDYMFETMRRLQCGGSLCTNDYDVCSMGSYTSAYKRQGEGLRKRDVPLGYMGIQSHMNVYPDIDLITKRLQILSEAGVPLFITEMDVREADMRKRGQGYEDLIRLYFSHPNVHGIILWGFWEENIGYPTAALVEGRKTLRWNEAGQRVANLWQKEWRTNEILVPNSRIQTLKTRGFYGDYVMTLYYDSKRQWMHEFTLGKDRSVNIDVTV